MNTHNRDLDNEEEAPEGGGHATTAGAAGAGAVTGAALGIPGGPAGMVVGAAAGAAFGAAAERLIHGVTGDDHFEGSDEQFERDEERRGFEVSPTDWENAKSHFRAAWSREDRPTGREWEAVEPRYRYGYEMALDPLYADKEWDDVEDDLRAHYDTWGQTQGYAEDPADWAERRREAYEAWSWARGGMPKN